MNFNIKKCAAMAALDRIKQKYPGAISYVEEIANATDFTDMWDHSMVYAPLPVAHAAMEKSYKREISRTDALDASVIAAAASWRLDKSIYDFSAELTKELFEVSCRKILNIDISSIHLPKKVIYIRPGIKMPGNIDGFLFTGMKTISSIQTGISWKSASPPLPKMDFRSVHRFFPTFPVKKKQLNSVSAMVPGVRKR